MQRLTSILILLVTISFLLVTPAFSWWGDDTLVTIDETRYSTDDFKSWWKHWNDEKLDLPKTPDPYIDWLLLAREGKSMDLASAPAFQRKSEVFLQVRSLILLQKEEINDKIKISDAEIREKYRELYTPRWLLQRLEFKDEAAAKGACAELAAGTLTIDDLLKRPAAQSGPVATREDLRRPAEVDSAWADIFRKLAVGQCTAPVPYDELSVVYRLKEKKGSDDEDFAQYREIAKDKLWKEKEEILTKELIASLRVKYAVKVDEERLAALVLTAPDEAYSDAPIVTTNRQNVTEKVFIDILRRDNAFRTRHKQDKASDDELKARVLNGILNQNLTNWAAIDKHYEEKEPFKSLYQFNVDHRLTREVEGRLLESDEVKKVTKDEIKSYYQANLSRYSQPEIVKIIIIEDVDGLVDRIWGEILTGKSFDQAVLKYTKKTPNIKDYPYNHLDPEVQKVVAGLAKGETSKPFVSEDQRFILRLIDRRKAQAVPLAEVSESIRGQLEKIKKQKKRKEYLELLKSRSKIEVNDSAWKALQKELGGAK